MSRKILRALMLTAGLFYATARASPQVAVQVAADQTSYNVGGTVRLEIIFPNASMVLPAPDFSVTLRYAGETQPLLDQIALPPSFIPSGRDHSTGYHDLWKIPFDARTGRYEIDLAARDSRSRQIVFSLPRAASFAVHRKLVRIDRLDLDKTFYTSGDPVRCLVTVLNLTRRPLTGLRVEFSDRYWPWVAPSSQRGGVEVFALDQALVVPANGRAQVASSHAATAKAVKQPTVHQYAAVVWDHERKNILDIAFSPLVFIQPPGVDSPHPYPPQFLYPDLGAVSFSSYRDFYPPDVISPAIQFDRTHTMLASGSEGKLSFTVTNRTPKPWRGVSIRARLLDRDGKELASQAVAEAVDIDSGGSSMEKATRFTFPAQESGLYRGEVKVTDPSGETLAVNHLELAVNPLPKSILIFCAHEDDEMAHSGMIRAAVENQVPLHVIYFTSGDAGSCDRYYQHSCGPAESLKFGALRMEEARSALAHLGVRREDIQFLGLPDGGSEQIWSNHILPSNPYLSVLLASDHAPYDGLARPNLCYARDSVVEMAKEFIRKFHPEVIYTGHPDERHVDHRTNNWFVVKALQELLRQGTISDNLTLLVDQVYGPGPQTPAPYHYQKHVLHVSGEARALAQEAEWFHQSQNGNRAQAQLRTLEQLPRTEIHWQVLDWKDHQGWNEKN